jgi:signal transduction histidine kinase
MNLATLASITTGIADYFIPPRIAADPDQRNQARVFLISHLFGPFIGNSIPLALFVLDPNPGMEIAVLAASITGFLAFPVLLKLTGLYRTLAVLSVQNLLFCILWSCYFYGGVTSPTLSWVLIIPLLAFFYIGHSPIMRGLVIGLMFTNLAVFLTVYVNFPAPQHHIPMEAIENLGIISMVATAAYVTMMALYFAKVFEAQSSLEELIGEHMRRADELRSATAEADRASAAKADFLAKMTHELRTPLNAIIGYSEMLHEDAKEEGDDESAADLDRIHKAGVHLLHLINEILDLAKIDAGKMEIFAQEVTLADTVREVADSLRGQAAERGNVVDIAIAPAVGSCLLDEHKLRQILQQLLDNALKFTSQGLISISAELEGCGADGQRIRLAVRDTGCGIADADLDRLFEQFTVLGDASSSKYGGTGLGLALSRKLCQLLGGDISATSELGRGSTFTVTLPLVRPLSTAGRQAALAA